MNNDIKISYDLQVGTGFVPPQFLRKGEDEYRIRNAQLEAMGKRVSAYRPLKPSELEVMVTNHNQCDDWSLVFVMDPFTPELIHHTIFSGFVRIGKLERVSLEHHDVHLFAGISHSQIIACDIGDNCVISDCPYIAHYIIGDTCILIDNAEIHASNHSKFGNGIVIEGEEEDIRITIDVMNEAGGRSIFPFEGMLPADAYLWARHREDERLMQEFRRMTNEMFDGRRGRYGEIGAGSVLKSNGVIKDVKIGDSAYIKGANKLKNLTIRSSETARTQIGEGVELVNGIIGYGCKVFYGCKAVRFVMCDNSALKYGARLIHSVLGENSTVSCCEILNNLIFPAHEQHHNTSFLIASLVKGQSNMAAGATIGSNHNSRAPDGEIEAGRGFWPGLCTSVKHSSRFASFCLLAKGDYRYELDIPFPFCLVDNDYARDRLVLLPAYWWTSNMYALMRNEAKFEKRDNRPDKSMRLEYSPFAPDTAGEIRQAMTLLEKMTEKSYFRWLEKGGEPLASEGANIAPGGPEGAAGRAILQRADETLPFAVFAEGVEHSTRECVIHKPAKAWKAYREMLLWFAGREITRFALAAPAKERQFEKLEAAMRAKTACPLSVAWENLGGMLVSSCRISSLLEKAAAGEFHTWTDLHAEYAELSKGYDEEKARCAWSVFASLFPESREGLSAALRELSALSVFVEDAVLTSRAKDWENPFRKATFRSEAEMTAVLGRPEKNSAVLKTREDMEQFRNDLGTLIASL